MQLEIEMFFTRVTKHSFVYYPCIRCRGFMCDGKSFRSLCNSVVNMIYVPSIVVTVAYSHLEFAAQEVETHWCLFKFMQL